MKKRFVLPVLREEGSVARLTQVLVSGQEADGLTGPPD